MGPPLGCLLKEAAVPAAGKVHPRAGPCATTLAANPDLHRVQCRRTRKQTARGPMARPRPGRDRGDTIRALCGAAAARGRRVHTGPCRAATGAEMAPQSHTRTGICPQQHRAGRHTRCTHRGQRLRSLCLLGARKAVQDPTGDTRHRPMSTHTRGGQKSWGKMGEDSRQQNPKRLL